MGRLNIQPHFNIQLYLEDKMKKFTVILMLVLTTCIFAQTADLVIKTDITQDYIDYLNNKLDQCNLTIASPTTQADAMKAYAERIFINASLIHCDVDDYVQEGLDFIDSLNNNSKVLEGFYSSNIKSFDIDEDAKHFFNNLLDLYKGSKLSNLKNELENMYDYYKYSLNTASKTSEDVLESIKEKLERISDDFKMLRHNEVQFSLRVRVISTGFNKDIDFNQSHFKRLDSILDLCDEVIDNLEETAEQFESVQQEELQPAEMINTLETAINNFSAGLDSLKELLDSSPLSLLEADTDWIDDVTKSLDDITDVLEGKEITIGNDNIRIRPVTLIEYSASEMASILLDFYRIPDRYSYTFGGLFPNGLPSSIVDELKEDMVLNLNDDRDKLDSRIQYYKSMYLAKLKLGQRTSSVYFGLAATQAYFYLLDAVDEIEDLMDYIQGGDFREGFKFSAINNTELTDSISDNYKRAFKDKKLVYTILLVTNDKDQPYTIDASTDYIPVFISMSAIDEMKDISDEFSDTVEDMAEYLKELYDDLDNMFDLSLDPNYLDFSNVENTTELLEVLEKSNPDFLQITNFGINKMKDMRGDLRKVFSEYAGYMNDLNELVDSLVTEHGDIEIDGTEVNTIISDVNDFVQDMNNDIQDPDTKTVINDVRVNLSAWFDNPPQNLLQKAKWFFDSDTTNDNTLGGLFPDGRMPSFIDTKDIVPEEYYLSQNYPNPFNPTTTISYSIPELSNVSLKVYDVLGREVATLVDEEKPAGNYQLRFNAGNLSSGVYYYKIISNNFMESRKMTFLK